MICMCSINLSSSQTRHPILDFTSLEIVQFWTTRISSEVVNLWTKVQLNLFTINGPFSCVSYQKRLDILYKEVPRMHNVACHAWCHKMISKVSLVKINLHNSLYKSTVGLQIYAETFWFVYYVVKRKWLEVLDSIII